MGSTPTGYSASRVSALIGLNQYQTPTEAFQILKEEQEPGWNAAHGYKLPPPPDNAAIRWGSAFEDAVIKLAKEAHGQDITDRERFFEKEIDGIRLTCHVDGIFLSNDPDDLLWSPPIHEGKTTNAYAYNSVKREINDAIDDDNNLPGDFSLIRRWGDTGTDQVPQEYQVQNAVQRICTGADLVKLSVLVFPKAAEDFESMGWRIEEDQHAVEQRHKFYLVNENQTGKRLPFSWAKPWYEQGNFHTYNLPSNPALETAIIQAVQNFDANHLQPGIPPDPSTWDDVKRLLSSPVGTIIATDDLRSKALEYSELTKQLGSTSPLRKRRDALKVEIMTEAMHTQRSDWTNPPGKLVIIDPNGGEVLASLSTDKNDQLSFRAVRAR